MKKINGLVLSTLTAAFLVGCGGGSSSDSGNPSTVTDVTVERGPLWGAEVIDATGKVAIQKLSNSNVYTFATAPTYPIKAKGGIIDLDGDSKTTDDIFDFTGHELSSYTNVITPITNYLGDITSDSGKAKLKKLEDFGLTKDELLNNLPSNTTTKKKEMLSLSNALFELMNDNNPNNDDISDATNYSSFKDRVDLFSDMIKDDILVNSRASSLALEETVLKGVLDKLTQEEAVKKIEEIKASVEVQNSTLTWESLPEQFNNTVDTFAELIELYTVGGWYVGEVILNTDGKVYDKETGLEEKGTWTTSSIETINIKLNDGQKIYLRVTKIGENYVIQNTPYDSEDSTSTPSEPTGTISVLGKQIVLGDSEGSMTAVFNTNGTYSESGLDSEGGQYNCSGLWKDLGNNKIGVTCQDNGTTEVPDGVIDENSNETIFQFSSSTLAVQGAVTITDADSSYPMVINAISPIESSTPPTPGEPTNFTLTNEMISGKSITITDSEGTMTALFNIDKSYSESWDDTKSGGNTGTCSGTWSINGNIVEVRGTCSDNESANTDITFTEEPKDGSVISFISLDNQEKGTPTITKFENISK